MIDSSLIAGIFSGGIQVFFGQPFDLIKTRIQSNGFNNRSYIHIIKNIYFNEGIFGFYKGVRAPLLSNCIINGIMFHSNHYINKNILKDNNNHFYSGAISGFISSFVISPFELVKNRIQIESKYNKKYSTVLLEIYKKKIFWKGLTPTIIREIPACSIYFGSHLYFKNHLNFYLNDNLSSFISGGLAGMSCWFFTYPFDTIKTKIQTSNNLTVYDILKKYKFKNYFNGISIVLYRAAIANSITFLVYDKTIEFIEK
jgi:hypothetical protein